ncbi:MAG: hypothetical protein F6K56_40375 [Moorea sp. SIO3G5]|nr:hypothetical protein [Moorena sp. SIO3G5]
MGIQPDLILVASLPLESWAIVTSGNYAIATNRLRHVGLPIPQILITTDDVSDYKPIQKAM